MNYWILTKLLAVSPPVESTLKLDMTSSNGQVQMTMPVQIMILLTLLTFLPAIIISLSSFTRIIIVFHFLRQALGTQEAPSNQILIGLALFLSFFIMNPTLTAMYNNAYEPWSKGQIDQDQALERGSQPLKQFMLKSTREKDLQLFMDMAGGPKPKGPDDLPMRAVIPAFMISEIKTAFQIGFVLFLPFLVIDMVVSSVLLSMGMMQLPPVMVSLPFKVLLFIMVDGWGLVVSSLVKSYV
ncbi:MAG: flagellar biosynthetic protein FliP [Acidobacteria bacterium]|nr:MAG: flagellar biosynthetic protein FliP [Acidobacteriota bacterium]PYS12678.1 MAG: flagellar biosynthetic protein FliP [Acidobacteriota bacterium]